MKAEQQKRFARHSNFKSGNESQANRVCELFVGPVYKSEKPPNMSGILEWL